MCRKGAYEVAEKCFSIFFMEKIGGGTRKFNSDGSQLFTLFDAVLSDAKSLHVGFDGAVNQEIPLRYASMARVQILDASCQRYKCIKILVASLY
ncbi:unnamed protein product [Litomosoides sigmodontis]|uniref:Uncharacterized protein n=1 Tax=Litomosoides sigmodontis TaxID=42156 RepID=A0A3P6SFZ8_LITSI|nr:unnamed protein product [Litomosoides sigmodontis]